MDRFEFFSRLPRLEPGSVSFTSLLLNTVEVQQDEAMVDLSAGAGDRSIWLARSRVRKVIAVNEDPRYNTVLQERSRSGGSDSFVETVTSDLMDLPFEPNSCKLILAEWAATKNGLKASVENWREFITPGGYLALSYPGVKNRDAPVEARGPLELRMAEPMDTLNQYLKIFSEAGLELQFQLPLNEETWDDFYADTLRRVWALKEEDEARANDPVLKSIHAEAKWYRRVGRGRVFLQGFLLKKV